MTPAADDVLDGVDLTGRTAVVTGGYSGVGLAVTRALTRAGARVVVPARRPGTARDALGGTAEVVPMDLADLSTVTAAALPARIDLLIGCAGIMACPETRVGRGWEAQFAVNHLGHYVLVQHLWPALSGARVVMVASGRDPSSAIRWDDVQFKRGYDKWAAYGQSKTANVLFARHLGTLGVKAFSAAPGYVLTPLQRHLSTEEMVGAGWIDADGVPAPGLFRTPEQGAATPVWAATAPELETRGGDYCADCAVTDAYPHEAADAARLWELSAELTGLDVTRTSAVSRPPRTP